MKNGMSPYNHRETERVWMDRGCSWTPLPGGTAYEDCPRDLLLDYGYEAIRLYELFTGRPVAGWNWTDGGMDGVYRFLARLWLFGLRQDIGAEPASRSGQEGAEPASGSGQGGAGPASGSGQGGAGPASGSESGGAEPASGSGQEGADPASGSGPGGMEPAHGPEPGPEEEGTILAQEMKRQVSGLWERGDGHGTVAALMGWFKKLKAFTAGQPVQRQFQEPVETLLALLEPVAPAFCYMLEMHRAALR